MRKIFRFLFLNIIILACLTIPIGLAQISKTNRTQTPSNQIRQKSTNLPSRPATFRDFAECVNWLKKSVYIIVRGRATEDGKTSWTTLGSGFVAAPYRLVTANHVINNPKKGESYVHKPGDSYYLLRHDDINSFHLRIFNPELNKEIFLYPDIDLAVVYLDEKFYRDGDKVFSSKDDYISISTDFLPLGSQIGILGYPLAALDFKDGNVNQPLIGDIHLRTDQGVINTRYKTLDNGYVYEFTLAFNPGNSGGPIFDVRNGKAISIVSGYNAVSIKLEEKTVTENEAKQFKLPEGKQYIDVVHANYSRGVASTTPSFVEVLMKHKILK